MSEVKALLDALAARSYERAVMITLVSLEGSGYRKPGARMIVADDGWSVGSVSGGCIENMLRDHAKRVLPKGAAEIVEIDTTSDADVLFGSGLGCPGKLRFRIEPFARGAFDAAHAALQARKNAVLDGQVIEPPIALHLFGWGNDVASMVTLAAAMQWETTVYAKHEVPRALPLDARSAAVLMTHNYFVDLDWLQHLMRTGAPYIAVIGARKRMEMMRAIVGDDPRLHGPAGLDIGSETPAEIALSVLAEITAVFARRPVLVPA
ncbi:MAG TPA: XdhC family protein [Thermoanaerobaculia bacterium]|nr:XdhC family protein [Thermoanaerobaculia bacterium]